VLGSLPSGSRVYLEGGDKTKRIAFILVVIGLASLPVAYTLNQLWSNTVHESVGGSLSLSSSDLSPLVGENVTFSASLLNGVVPVVGKTVTFYCNASAVGSAVTNGSGVAVWSWQASGSSDWNCSYSP
jgi:hypothetical protein